jgi:hypothetical protein
LFLKMLSQVIKMTSSKKEIRTECKGQTQGVPYRTTTKEAPALA